MRGLLLLLLPLAACTPDKERTRPTPADPGDTGSHGTDTDTGGDTDTDTGPGTDADGDGFAEGEDCDDTDAEVFPGAPERCNLRDDDCDGEADDGLAAPWCITAPAHCPLAPDARDHAAPIVHLSFDEADDPWRNQGSLGALTWWGDVSSADRGAVGAGRRFARAESGADSNGYAVFATQPELQVETFTVAAWIHPDRWEDRGTILNMLWDSAPAGLSLDYYAGFVRLALGDGREVVDLWAPAPAGTWTHVAATWDGVQAALYVDGDLRLREAPARPFAGVAHHPANLMLGAYQDPAYYAFDGVLDEVQLWDHALSPAELRESLTLARFRFEEGDGADAGPAARDGALVATTACGPVGEAWQPEGTALEVDLPPLTDGFGLTAWVRPGTGGSVAAVDGAWAVHASAEDLELTVTCDDGTRAAAVAEGVLTPDRWAETAASFRDGHLRLHVDGVEVADERAGCFTLAESDAGLVVGDGFDGGLDEVELRAVPRPPAEVQQTARWAGWRATDPTAETRGLPDRGPLALDLVGETRRREEADLRYPCLHVQDAFQQACAHVAGQLDGEAALHGPLTLHAWARPLGTAGDTTLLGVEDGPTLGVEDGLPVLRWGGVEVVGTVPLAEEAWTPLAGAVSHDALRLYQHGVLVGEAALSTGAGATERFEVGSGLSWQGDEAWVEASGVDGFAWTADTALARHAPWRTEDHPRLASAEALATLTGDGWDDWCAQGRDLDPEDGSVTHYERSLYAWYCAEAALQSGERGVPFETALALLVDVDHGDWDWAWMQGRALYWYALAYDRLAPLLLAREAEDPHAHHAEHALLRRRFASALHRIATVGDIAHDDVLLDHGYFHPDPLYLTANSRLMSVSGSGHLALAMPAMVDGDFGTAEERLDLVVDDLFYERPAAYEASGLRNEAYLHASGLYTEGPGYQSDVYTGMTPFLIDWWQLGGEDRVTGGRIRAMYDANVASMLPTGHVWPYATGWVAWQVHSDLVAEFVEDEAAEEYRWFDARQHGRSGPYRAPAWTSAVLGDEAVVLRSGWEEDDLWLGLKGRTEPCPASHCQEDQLSLMLMAHGARLLIDPGDGRGYQGTPEAAQEAWLQSAAGHNNVLVDGAGPGLVREFGELVDPAEVTASLLAPRADYGRMEGTVDDGAARGGADHTRHVWLVDDAFFVILDELSAAGEATFAQQFHLGGPTDSGDGTLVTLGPDFTWSTTSDDGTVVELDVVQLAPARAVVLHTATDGGTNFNDPLTWDHTYVHARTTGTDATYLTLLLTGTAADPPPAAAVLSEAADLRHAVVTLPDGTDVEVGHNATGTRQAPGVADTDGLLWGTDGQDWAFLADGSQLEVDDTLAAWATCPLQALQLERDGDTLTAFVAREAGSCSLDVAWPDGEPARVAVDGVESSAWSWADGVLMLTDAPEERLEVSGAR